MISEYSVNYFLTLGKHSCEHRTLFNDQPEAYCEKMGLLFCIKESKKAGFRVPALGLLQPVPLVPEDKAKEGGYQAALLTTKGMVTSGKGTPMLPRPPSSLALNTFMDGASTASPQAVLSAATCKTPSTFNLLLTCKMRYLPTLQQRCYVE